MPPMIWAPIDGWDFMMANSSSVSLPGLFRMESLIPTLPRSCSTPPQSIISRSLRPHPISAAMILEISATRFEWPRV